MTNKKRTANTGLAKVAVQCSADQPRRMVKIATFAKPENASNHNNTRNLFKNKFAIDALLVYIYTTKRNIMRRQSISFTEPNDEWLKSQIENKEYSSKSELVNDLIRQARNQQKQIDLIRLKLDKAEKSGFTTESKSEILKQSKSMLNG
jgi:antitoxin ParD1/3/4